MAYENYRWEFPSFKDFEAFISRRGWRFTVSTLPTRGQVFDDDDDYIGSWHIMVGTSRVIFEADEDSVVADSTSVTRQVMNKLSGRTHVKDHCANCGKITPHTIDGGLITCDECGVSYQYSADRALQIQGVVARDEAWEKAEAAAYTCDFKKLAIELMKMPNPDNAEFRAQQVSDIVTERCGCTGIDLFIEMGKYINKEMGKEGS